MLTGSDSPRPDQQALAPRTVWALLYGKRAQLRGPATASATIQARGAGLDPQLQREGEKNGERDCVSVCSTVDWYTSHCQPLLLPLALLFARSHPGLLRLRL